MLKTAAASAQFFSTSALKASYLHGSCRLLHSVTEVPRSSHGIESITQLPPMKPSSKHPKGVSKGRTAVILKEEKGENDRLPSPATPVHRRLQDLLNTPRQPLKTRSSRRNTIKEKPFIKTRFKNSLAAQKAIRPAVQSARVKEIFQREGAEEAIDFVFTAPRDTLDTVVWNTLLAQLMIIRRRKRAYEIYTEMKRRGFSPTSRTFKTMLTGMNSTAAYEWPSQAQNLERCHKLYDALESYAEICKQQQLTREFPAICAARGAYVRILGKTNDYQRIVDIFYKTDNTGPLSRDKYLYEALLWGLLLRKEAEQVGALSLAEQNASDAKFYWRSLEKDLERGMEIDSYVIRPFIKLMAAGRPVDQQFGFNVVREFFGLVPPGEDAPTPRVPLCIVSFQAVLELCNKSKKFRLCTYFMKQVSEQLQLNLKTVSNLTIGYRHINEQLIALAHLAAVGSFNESERALDALRYLKSAAAIEAQKPPQLQRVEDLTLHTETVTLALGVCWRCGDWERAAEIFSLATDLPTEQFLDNRQLALGTSRPDEHPAPKKRLVYTNGFTHLARTALSTEDASKMRQCLRIMHTYGVDVAPFETHNNFYKRELAKATVRLVDAASPGWKSEEVKMWREMKHESIQVLSKRIPIERPEQEDAGLGSEKYIGKLQQAIDFELSSRGSV